MGLPFERQSWEELNQRLPAALSRVWNSNDIAEKKTLDRPGLHRDYVFDTPDGWRLIISREIVNGSSILHVSCSINNDPADLKHWLEKIFNQDDAIAAALVCFKQITGLKETGVAEAAMTSGGVIHFMYPLP
jgi:hypothetical protein